MNVKRTRIADQSIPLPRACASGSGAGPVVEDDRALGTRVDVEREHVRPRVVADGVEHAPLLLDGGEVEVGVHDLLALYRRPGEDVSPWRDDGGVAARHPVVVEPVDGAAQL